MLTAAPRCIAARVAVDADPSGRRARVRLRAGQVAPRLLSLDASGARIALLSITATLLAGDDVRLEVAVGPGAWLELVDVAAVVAYSARGGRARWTVDLRVGPGGTVTWHGLPMVVCEGADVARRIHAVLGDGAIVVLRDTVVLGRTGERGGSLLSSARVDLAGRPLLAEDLDLTSADAAAPSTAPPRAEAGMLGQHRVLDTISVLGCRAALAAVPKGCTRYDLAGPGTLMRHVGAKAHGSPLGDVWPECLAVVRRP
jgi:urease accessory protein